MSDLSTEHRGYTVQFSSDDHVYTLLQASRMESVTTFIGRFFPKFDTDKVATKYAAKNKLDKDQVIAQWDKKRDAANQLGTAIHEYAEKIFEGTAIQLPQIVGEKEEAYRQSVLRAITKIADKFDFIESEKIVFDTEHLKAGMIDLVLRDKSNGDIVLMDWKTNESIDQTNNWRNALPPIEKYEDCNFIKYSLQLNMYKYIAMHNEYYPGANIRMGLIHLKPDGTDWYRVGGMQNDIKEMLGHG